MALQMLSASFGDASPGPYSSTATEDRRVLSLLFDELVVKSERTDTDAAPQVRRVEGVIQCAGTGWISVQVRGAALVAGLHGFAHVAGWINGRRLRVQAQGPDEPFCSATAAPVGADGQLRISLLMLAQRDLASADSAAQCWVDSIDLAVMDWPRQVGGAKA